MRKASLYRYVQALRTHLRGIELQILTLILVLGIGGWVFLEVADAVLEGEVRKVDGSLLLAMRTPSDLSDPIGPFWVEEVGRDITALGGVAVLVLLTLATAVYLFLIKRKRVALFVLGAIAGGNLLSVLFKAGFDRPRPDLVPHEAHVYSASFPSGHSMMSAVVYLTLGALLARIHSQRTLKIYFLGLAVLLTVAVGVSRVYLGVHWPTDVLAGWSAGAVWATFCWLVALWFQHRGMVEESVEEEEGISSPQEGEGPEK